jgi:RIO kinase 1
MLSEINKKLESKIDKELIEKLHRGKIPDGFKKNKTINEVLDKPTTMTLYHMIKSNVISYVNGAIKAGKESVVFWGVNEKEEAVALKVYLTKTSNFKNRYPYILGDPRFRRIKKGTRNLVYLWAKKEFRNLTECFEAKIPVPRPIEVSNNVLAMEFVGNKGIPAKTLLESEIDHKDYESAISIIKNLYKDAKLVHGDFSEYNIFKTKKGLIVFDLGSAVNIEHPNSKEFLKRDINNISHFFVKRGLTVENPSDVLGRITN